MFVIPSAAQYPRPLGLLDFPFGINPNSSAKRGLFRIKPIIPFTDTVSWANPWIRRDGILGKMFLKVDIVCML